MQYMYLVNAIYVPCKYGIHCKYDKPFNYSIHCKYGISCKYDTPCI